MSKDDGRFSTVIRVDLREQFFSENKPGRLVNDLLEAHYGGSSWVERQREMTELLRSTSTSGPINLGTGEIVDPNPTQVLKGDALDPDLVEWLATLKRDWPGYPFRINSDKETVEVHHKRKNVWVDVNEVDLTEM